MANGRWINEKIIFFGKIWISHRRRWVIFIIYGMSGALNFYQFKSIFQSSNLINLELKTFSIWFLTSIEDLNNLFIKKPHKSLCSCGSIPSTVFLWLLLYLIFSSCWQLFQSTPSLFLNTAIGYLLLCTAGTHQK